MHRPDQTGAAERQPDTTLLESFDSWAQLLRAGDSPRVASPPAGATPPVDGKPAPVARGPLPREVATTVPDADHYRPMLRRPLALLHVIDDGREDGETIRLRGDSVVIGRTDGEVTIPHDISMSARHALLQCGAGAVWQLSDLGSAGGTFVRVLAARLHDGSCLQLGATRFRFDVVDGGDACLVELLPDRDGTRHACRSPRTTVGRTGAGCDIGITDRFVSPLHAELRPTAGGWRIDNRGLNGLWVRIEAPVKLAVPSQFQCGEQRFVFVPLGE